MKGQLNIEDIDSKVEAHEERQVKQEYKLVHQMGPGWRGHTLYSLNLKTDLIEEVEMTSKVIINAIDPTKNRVQKRVEHKKDHLYLRALNKKNARKKFNKIMNRG